MCWDMRFKVSLTEREIEVSSTFRELRVIEEGLRAHGDSLWGKIVRWVCDNWSAGKIVKWGLMKRDCHEVAVRINSLIQRLEIDFEVVWQKRETEEIRFADSLSKDFDFVDYKISMSDFERLSKKYGLFTADYFVSDYSFRMKPFYARYLSGECQASDAFSVRWDSGRGYFHPPVGLVPRLLEWAKVCKSEGILLVPDWPGSTV